MFKVLPLRAGISLVAMLVHEETGTDEKAGGLIEVSVFDMMLAFQMLASGSGGERCAE